MADGILNHPDWPDWQRLLLDEFDKGMGAIAARSPNGMPQRTHFCALCLQVTGFPGSTSDTLSQAILLLRQNTGSETRLDTFAMLGHRVGILENTTEFNRYLQSLREALKPAGRVVFTSVSLNTQNAGQSRPTIATGAAPGQIQCKQLIGPYFSLMRLKSGTLENQAALNGWGFEMLSRQDEDNYAAVLTLA